MDRNLENQTLHTSTPDADIKQKISKLLESQQAAVLSTMEARQPYSCLVAYAVTSDLKTLIFATPKATRKFVNITADPCVSLLVDNRKNDPTDFQETSALTIQGNAYAVSGPERLNYKTLYLQNQPSLQNFTDDPTTVFVKVVIDEYILVNRFQHVETLRFNG
ncbi:MAG TPA: pyridoxamine 5'-phosphate oxidase family protein [Desulfobulbaceae bacterium]|nr:pyridoxamine 5'-phosphate oxidase family protein [Desulfobulbaceae bacterium]